MIFLLISPFISANHELDDDVLAAFKNSVELPRFELAYPATESAPASSENQPAEEAELQAKEGYSYIMQDENVNDFPATTPAGVIECLRRSDYDKVKDLSTQGTACLAATSGDNFHDVINTSSFFG